MDFKSDRALLPFFFKFINLYCWRHYGFKNFFESLRYWKWMKILKRFPVAFKSVKACLPFFFEFINFACTGNEAANIFGWLHIILRKQYQTWPNRTIEKITSCLRYRYWMLKLAANCPVFSFIFVSGGLCVACVLCLCVCVAFFFSDTFFIILIFETFCFYLIFVNIYGMKKWNPKNGKLIFKIWMKSKGGWHRARFL